MSADNKSENRQNKIESKTNINFVFMQFLIYIFIKKQQQMSELYN